MSRTTISTKGAPAAIGPYVQAVLRDAWLYTSGQIALDPGSGEMVGTGDDATAAEVQTQQVLNNLEAVLEASGATHEDVVKCTVYLANMDHFAAVNGIYEGFFGTDSPPARSTVEVSRLPKGALVEIDVIARVTDPRPASSDWSLESPSLMD